MHILEPLVYRLFNAPEKLTVQVLSESSTVNHCQSKMPFVYFVRHQDIWMVFDGLMKKVFLMTSCRWQYKSLVLYCTTIIWSSGYSV